MKTKKFLYIIPVIIQELMQKHSERCLKTITFKDIRSGSKIHVTFNAILENGDHI